MTDNDLHIPPVTEDDIANFLASTPDFFARHAELLASVQLVSQHGSRAVSLQERQAEMLREKIKALESRIMEMVRNGNENVVIANRLQQWTRSLMLVRDGSDLPDAIAHGLQDGFMVPQVAIRVWGVAAEHAQHGFALGATEDTQTFASSLNLPYCGVNSGFEAAAWLAEPAQAASIALLPLRQGGQAQAFGLLVLASPDGQRFQSGMGTEFLERIAETASAALSRLL